MPPVVLRTRTFLARYLTLFGGETFGKLCVLVAFAYLARVLSPSDYGIVETALSATVFLVLGVESGMGAYGARVVAAQPEELSRLLPRIMLLRALLGIPVIVGIMVVATVSRTATAGVVAISGIAVLFTPFLTQWVFQGLRQMQWVAASGALRNLVFAAVVLLLVRPGSDVRLVAVAEVAGIVALALLNSYYLYWRLRVRIDFHGALRGARRLFGDVLPLGLSDFAWACLWYSPVIIVGWVGSNSPEQAAWVAAPMRIVTALHTFVWLYFFNLLPNLAHELAVGLDSWRELMRRSLGFSMWPAGLIAVVGTLAAPAVVPMVFGAHFAPAVLPFQVVVWIIPVAWFSGHFRFTLIAAGQQRWEFAALAAGAAVTVLSTIILSRRFGGPGAAAAFLAGGIVNAILAVWASSRTVGSSHGLPTLRPWLVATVLGLLLGGGVLRVIGPLAGSGVGGLVFLFFGFRQQPELVHQAVALLRR